MHLHYVDGRRFIRETDSRYDIVLLNMPSPSTLQKNRFFTEESFALVSRILKQGGIFRTHAARLPRILQPGVEGRQRSVLLSLNAVFPYHYVVPGDTNIFLASISPDIARVTPELLHERLKAAQVPTNLITYAHLADRFQQRRRDWFRAALDNVDALSNRDFRPSGVFYEIAYENLMLTPSLKPLLAWLQRVTFPVGSIVCHPSFLHGCPDR